MPASRRAVFRWAILDKLTGKRKVQPHGPPAPWVQADLEAARDKATARVTWIGHASFLATIGGKAILLDPVFSEKIGFFIHRHGKPGLTREQLPPIDALLITHNHYDHLDEPSVLSLPRDLPVFTPEGLGAWFTGRGFTRVTDLAWWQSARVDGVTITAVPARHWSRRRLADTNETHWCGYVIQGGGKTLYDAGDTAAFSGFSLIAERFPAIDVALLPIGAYTPAWFMEQQHMNPSQAIDAFSTLRARMMVPMHWGSIQLTDEPLLEPMERLGVAWAKRGGGDALRLLPMGGSIRF
ncbi:MAG TPA: MBL fold metallo-hydrolase [Candidatus Polarisedimenticolaceae bacterium]|nr:MBL fold metallo-hydrolase [Candidatus Polarisedimenticolaceae bacterium]